MDLPNKPTKEQIRQYMSERLSQQCSPPSTGDIRRQLGWGLVPSTEDGGCHGTEIRHDSRRGPA